MTGPVEISNEYFNIPLLVDATTARTLADYYPARIHFKREVTECALGDLTASGPQRTMNAKPYPVHDGVAMISVYGFLENRSMYAGKFSTGYDSITHRVQAAQEDPDVNGIMLDIDSPGGEVAGCFECAKVIANSTKPVHASVSSGAYSAAYALASAAESISLPETGGVGSIGVVMMHIDESKLLDDIGIKPTLIYAGKHKVDGSPFKPLSKSAKDKFQSDVDNLYDIFVGTVAANRGLTEDDVRGTEAATYQAMGALEEGLADAIMAPSEALASFSERVSAGPSASTNGSVTMSTENTPEPVELQEEQLNEARAMGAFDEQQRIAAILDCEESVGREALAKHLAFKTNMTVEEAQATLMAQPPVPQAHPDPEPVDQNHFATAMDNTENPEVGDGEEGGKDELAEVFELWGKVCR